MVLMSGRDVGAGEVKGLYEVDRIVAGQGDDVRHRALSEAMSILLIRIIGNHDAVEHFHLAQYLQKAEGFIERYQYFPVSVEDPGEKKDPQPRLREDASADVTEQYRLHVIFDRRAIDELIRRHQAPLWESLRPTLLIWLAVDDGRHRYILSPDVSLDLNEVIREVGQRRGLPVILPLLDLDEQSKIRFSDVWGDFGETINAASQRYRAGSSLVGRAFLRGGQWTMRWSLYHDRVPAQWESTAVAFNDGLSAALEHSVDLLGTRFAVRDQAFEGAPVTMEVQGVTGISAYARLMAYVEGLDMVRSVVVTRLSSDRIDLLLDLRRQPEHLKKVIEFGDTLAPARTAGLIMAERSKGVLIYRLLQ